MLRLLMGRARSGKSERVLREIKALGDTSSQTTSPFSSLNNSYFKRLSNFLGSLHSALLFLSHAFCLI